MISHKEFIEVILEEINDKLEKILDILEEILDILEEIPVVKNKYVEILEASQRGARRVSLYLWAGFTGSAHEVRKTLRISSAVTFSGTSTSLRPASRAASSLAMSPILKRSTSSSGQSFGSLLFCVENFPSDLQAPL